MCDCITCETKSSLDSIYDCEGYRLPTNAEWEYAAPENLEGINDTTPLGDGDIENFKMLMNTLWNKKPKVNNINVNNLYFSSLIYGTNYDIRRFPHPGFLSVNSFGLYNMNGNVAEYVHDKIAHNISEGIQINPVGPETISDELYITERFAGKLFKRTA